MNIQTPHKKNINLASTEVKNRILNYLYKKIKQNVNHETIKGEKDMNIIRDNEYIICPRFNGTRSWILFFQLNDVFYAVNFPKHSQYKKKDIQIYPINISVAKEFYHGTIMEGIYFRMEEDRYLFIDDVYMLGGHNQLLKPKDDRLNNLSKYIAENTLRNPNFSMYVSQFYQTTKNDLKDLFEKIKSDTKIQEIIFYPRHYGVGKIYNYTIIDTDFLENVIKTTQFRMQKTDKADVYNLLSTTSGNKIAIAYLPDMETSKKCKQWFKDNKAKELVVKCQMDMDKKKWIPLELVENDFENDEIENSHDSSESDDDSVDV